MNWKEWVFIILGSFLLVGFVFWAESRPKLEEGTVIEKEFIPAHTNRTTISIPHRVGKITTVSVIPFILKNLVFIMPPVPLPCLEPLHLL